jgi:hypothetical protein
MVQSDQSLAPRSIRGPYSLYAIDYDNGLTEYLLIRGKSQVGERVVLAFQVERNGDMTPRTRYTLGWNRYMRAQLRNAPRAWWVA